MKISIVMPVLNDARIGRALDSVLSQQRSHELEIIVVDAASTDHATREALDRYRDNISVLISEPDDGIFDGMNKGIRHATGEVVGILNSDDYYSDALVIRDVMDVFSEDEEIDACYGDQICVNKSGKLVRYWKSREYREANVYFGWLLPHPTFFVRKRVYERFGAFDLRYPIAADQDFILRLLLKHKIKVKYLRRVLTNMAVGGNSTRNIWAILMANLEVVRICWNLGLPKLFLFPVLKPVRKIFQYISRP